MQEVDTTMAHAYTLHSAFFALARNHRLHPMQVKSDVIYPALNHITHLQCSTSKATPAHKASRAQHVQIVIALPRCLYQLYLNQDVYVLQTP